VPDAYCFHRRMGDRAGHPQGSWPFSPGGRSSPAGLLLARSGHDSGKCACSDCFNRVVAGAGRCNRVCPVGNVGGCCVEPHVYQHDPMVIIVLVMRDRRAAMNDFAMRIGG